MTYASQGQPHGLLRSGPAKSPPSPTKPLRFLIFPCTLVFLGQLHVSQAKARVDQLVFFVPESSGGRNVFALQLTAKLS